MSAYSDQVKRYIERYKAEVRSDGLIDPHELAQWAYDNGLHKPNVRQVRRNPPHENQIVRDQSRMCCRRNRRADGLRRSGAGASHHSGLRRVGAQSRLRCGAKPWPERFAAARGHTARQGLRGQHAQCVERDADADRRRVGTGYAAGYYGYMWSQVLALDMLSAFGENIMNPAVGRRFRETILANGGQVPAKDLVREFLGREPNSKAFYDELAGKR